ncbi:phage/plasmid primase, P4 family [Clostridium sp. KNHs216]|uniref:phage/plasmid primase, P4 family n=1 Tax=Clostridium sp. KNHs216 TaxID=1550235 RepID=UPI00114E8B63|nr:phage/plasmid primase, P4 family [Clostridium sp. KNHs216]TQI66746.1 putative DNA primase/helicase [Clostridium sp. KNHs216]
MGLENIPVELIQRPQWVCHRFPNKMPLSPRLDQDGKLCPAKADNSRTWGSFDEAVRAVREYGASGIGFEFGDGICGVDVDHCINDDGELSNLAKEVVSRLQSYTEISPSGTGIHVLCKGHLPDREGRKDQMLGLEMYDRARYFTVTGNVYCDEEGIPYPLRECTPELDELHRKYLTKEKLQQVRLADAAGDSDMPEGGGAQQIKESNPIHTQPESVRDLSDQDILDIAFRSRNGEEIKQLFEGDWSGAKYPSQSEADFAFASYLAFWFNRDLERMDRVFRSSGLFRQKWDRSVGGKKTYGQYTLSRAMKGKEKTFIPYDRTLTRDPVPLPEPPPEYPKEESAAPPVSPPAAPEDPEILKDPKMYTLDDTGNAYRFRDAYCKGIKFDHINKIWMIWTGQRWTEDQTGEVKRLADDLLERMWKEASPGENKEANDTMLKHIRRTRSSKSKKAMIEETQHLPGIPILPNELDRYKDALNVANGIVDLKTGQLRPHDRRLKMSLLADVEYIEGAKCPLWMKFLNEITQGDKELQLYIQRMVGYFLTGSTAEQCLFFLYGTGANGKSTFVNMISSLFGDYTKNAQSDTIMRADRGNSSSARSDIARLKSVRLVTTSEPSGGCVLDEALVKTMTGEDVITARKLYKEEFQFRPEFKIVMATNVKPIIKHSDHGIWRRVRMLPFVAQIPDEKKDIHLAEKLQTEKAGIFQWALKGAVEWYKKGMPSCAKVNAANEEYRKEMDKMQQFVDDCVISAAGCSIPSGKLYSVYRAWCTDRGERYPASQSKFSLDLQDNYHFYKRKTARFNEFVDISLSEAGNQFAAMAPSSPQ